MSGDDISGDLDSPMTRRAYLVMKTLLENAEKDEPVSFNLVLEAVSSTAIEHPEWDMGEERTWKEWERYERERSDE